MCGSPWPFRCPAGEKILERQAEKKAQSEKQAKVHGRRSGIHWQPPRFWSVEAQRRIPILPETVSLEANDRQGKPHVSGIILPPTLKASRVTEQLILP